MNKQGISKLLSIEPAQSYFDKNDIEWHTFTCVFEDGIIMNTRRDSDTIELKEGDNVQYTIMFSNTYGHHGNAIKVRDDIIMTEPMTTMEKMIIEKMNLILDKLDSLKPNSNV